jgi:hypothetical protein
MNVRMKASGVSDQAASNTGWAGFFILCFVVLAVTAPRRKSAR